MAEEARKRYYRIRRENSRGIGNAYFSLEPSANNDCRFVVKPDHWDPENSQSCSGNDMRCFLCTVFGECAFARDQISIIKTRTRLKHKIREFVLMKERCEQGDSDIVVFKKVPDERCGEEPFLIGEILIDWNGRNKIVLFRDLDDFLNRILNINKTLGLSEGVECIPLRPPSAKEVENLNCYNSIDDSCGEYYVPYNELYDSANPFKETEEEEKKGNGDEKNVAKRMKL